MKSFLAAMGQQVQYYRKWDFAVFTLLTLLSVWSGQTTVFYLIYLFWWNELLHLVVDKLYYKGNKNAVCTSIPQHGNKSVVFFQSLFMMGIYAVFIIVFFGFIASVDNTEIIIANMRVLVFQNCFFNINLILIVLERWYLHRRQQPLVISFNPFSSGRIVLHISIILGGFLMFFVVKPYPALFTPQNLLGSVVIALPFIVLKMGMQYVMSPDPKTK